MTRPLTHPTARAVGAQAEQVDDLRYDSPRERAA
jgi:hypothetical protein